MGARYPHMLLILLLLLHGADAASDAKWQTLDGSPPLVIAHGGFAGLFPDSSAFAYQFAMPSSLHNVVLYCDLQLSSDGKGFCKTGLTLENSTLIAEVFPKRDKTYKVNGEDIHGWFSLDFKSEELYDNVTLIQNIFSRPSTFDGVMGMFGLDDVVGLRPPQIWVNVEYSIFYQEHKLSSEDYLLGGLPKDFSLGYISSPEIEFLKSLGGKLKESKTKLIFRFLNLDVVEPSTKKTYGEILKDLKSIKAFAAGISVPKEYIWPLSKALYLVKPTTLVKDAHALGLEVYASGFANDVATSYNYSYDPISEYLQFIDNSEFSIDGIITDFPPTASEAVACLAHTRDNPLPPPGNGGRPLIISHGGASGVFAGSTDLAYHRAVKDGADIIDCSVQMSKDGVPFCMTTMDLSSSTTAATTFTDKITTVTEVQNKSGIFAFDLSWSEIQTLKPNLAGPYTQAGLKRNPAAMNAGKIMTLADFLELAKASTVSGILIEIEFAAFMAKKGLGVVDAVSRAMVKAGYDKPETKKEVLIESDDTSVLAAFKKFPAFERVLAIDHPISDASKPSVAEINEFASSVSVTRSSIAKINGFFLTGFTDVVERMHEDNISVYIGVLRNEFMNLGFDYWADPTVEIATYTASVAADGLITEFPATAAAYFKSPCSDMSLNLSYSILPANPGALLTLVTPGALPPALPPAPMLEPADVKDPPLPPVSIGSPPEASPADKDGNSSSAATAGYNIGGCLVVAAIAALLSIGFH